MCEPWKIIASVGLGQANVILGRSAVHCPRGEFEGVSLVMEARDWGDLSQTIFTHLYL